MTTTTQITNIAHLLDLTPYAGEFIADYDMDAVHSDFLDQLNYDLVDGITVLSNGDVIADIKLADRARDTDWKTVVDGVDPQAFFERHDFTTRITELPDGTSRGVDHAGNLVVAFGPDKQDGDGNTVEESDQHWIATLYTDDEPGPTETGTRTEIEAQARNWMKGRASASGISVQFL